MLICRNYDYELVSKCHRVRDKQQTETIEQTTPLFLWGIDVY